jgi:hypothetical protein
MMVNHFTSSMCISALEQTGIDAEHGPQVVLLGLGVVQIVEE